jgi:ABC-2 type transport system ATP-binding protein
MNGDPGSAIVDLRHIAKHYDGVETSLRGTKLEWKGPALWARNLRRAVSLTANPAPPVQALVDITLRVHAGEIFGLLGSNGSGKTTLIKIIAGLLRATAGDGTVVGCPLDEPQEIRKRVSYVSTSGWMGLEWPLTALDNIRFFAVLCGMPDRLARDRAEQAMRDVELWPDRHKYPSQLSNGMRQRVILARALLFHTPLVLLDEPTVGLDPTTTRDVLALIRGPLRDRGQTMLLTDHQSAEIEAVADRIAILRAGRIWLEGTPGAIRARLAGLTVIEVRTEGMETPSDPPPPIVVAHQRTERPGPLGERVWRVHAHQHADALEAVVDWLEQPTGRIVLLAERDPSLADVLALPDELVSTGATPALVPEAT